MVCKSSASVNHLHLHVQTFYTYIYIAFPKCFGACKCIYYIPLMTIPFCKSILISCGCIPKLKFIFIFLQWASLIDLSQNIIILWYSPNISISYQYETMVVLLQGVSWMHILFNFIVWIELLFLILFVTIFGTTKKMWLDHYNQPPNSTLGG